MNTRAPTTLAQALRQARAGLQAQRPPAELQARVRAAALAALPGPQREPVRTAPRRADSGPGWRGGAVGLALASVLAGTVLLLLRPAPTAVVDDGPRLAGFVSVAPAEQWPRGNAPAWLVSTELQRGRLAALGLPYDPVRAGDSVRAELLLNPAGEVLAVRLLN